MIRLTRYAGKTPLVVNLATIAYIEELPDTFVALLSGERVHVRESAAEIIERALAWQHQVLAGPVVHVPDEQG